MLNRNRWERNWKTCN